MSSKKSSSSRKSSEGMDTQRKHEADNKMILKAYEDRKANGHDPQTLDLIDLMDGELVNIGYDNLLWLLLHYDPDFIVACINQGRPVGGKIPFYSLRTRFHLAAKRIAKEQGKSQEDFMIEWNKERRQNGLEWLAPIWFLGKSSPEAAKRYEEAKAQADKDESGRRISRGRKGTRRSSMGAAGAYHETMTATESRRSVRSVAADDSQAPVPQSRTVHYQTTDRERVMHAEKRRRSDEPPASRRPSNTSTRAPPRGPSSLPFRTQAPAQAPSRGRSRSRSPGPRRAPPASPPRRPRSRSPPRAREPSRGRSRSPEPRPAPRSAPAPASSPAPRSSSSPPQPPVPRPAPTRTPSPPPSGTVWTAPTTLPGYEMRQDAQGNVWRVNIGE